LHSMDHLDQNIYAPGVFQIQRYTRDSLEVVKGITNGRLFYSNFHSKRGRLKDTIYRQI